MIDRLYLVGYAAAALVLLTALTASHRFTYTAGQASIQSKWNLERAATAEAILLLQQAYLEKEREWQDESTGIQRRLYLAEREAQEQLDRVVSDRDAGALRLRQRFQACERDLSAAATTPGGGDGPAPGGFSRADENFLVRIAAEADVVAQRLTACQDYARVVAGAH